MAGLPSSLPMALAPEGVTPISYAATGKTVTFTAAGGITTRLLSRTNQMAGIPSGEITVTSFQTSDEYLIQHIRENWVRAGILQES